MNRLEKERVLLLDDTAVGSNNHYIPGDHFAAVLEGLLHRVTNPAATGNLHPEYGYTFDLMALQYLGQLFTVIDRVQLGAADQGDFVAHEFLVNIGVGVGSAVRSHQ